MCEANSPPNVNDPLYVVHKDTTKTLREGDKFQDYWGPYTLTLRVDEDRGCGKLTGGQRLACTVVDVQLTQRSKEDGIPNSKS